MADISKMLDDSYKTLNELQRKLGDLEQIHLDIKRLRDEAILGKDFSNAIPVAFKEKLNEISKLSSEYVNNLSIYVDNYLSKNQSLFLIEIEKLDNKIKDFNLKLVKLDVEIERIKKVDFEKHFDKLQKTLADIFGAINTINLTLANTVQTLTTIVQSLGTIQTAIDANSKETKQLLNSFGEATEKHLTDQDKQATTNVELLETKIKFLVEQNKILSKGIKASQLIQIVGILITVSFLIYFALKKG